MMLPQVVSEHEWRAALEPLRVKEKEATRARDALAAERRRLPMSPSRRGTFSRGRTARRGRHRLINDRLAAELARSPGLRVVVIGCGFDSRPFRLRGGRWIEVDEPSLLAYKDSRLPVSESPNELVRVPIRFDGESLEEKLAPYATEDRAVVVLEGVLGYLGDDARRELLSTLGSLFPDHIAFCDMLTRTFLTRYARKLVKLIREIGADFSSSSDTPDALFHDLGYRTVERVSVVLSAAELGAKGAPPAWLTRRLPSLRDGYCLWGLARSPEQD